LRIFPKLSNIKKTSYHRLLVLCVLGLVEKICSHPSQLIQQAMTWDVKWTAVTQPILLVMPTHHTNHMFIKLMELLMQ
jgi:hypothetical protein